MAEINVRSEVREYPDGDRDYHTLIVCNHETDRSRIILEIESMKYTFIAAHLIKAIENAQNAH